MKRRFDRPCRFGRSLLIFRTGGRACCITLIAVGLLAGPGQALADEEPVESRDERPIGGERRWQQATPEERQVVRERARRRWEEASPRERRFFRRGISALEGALPDFSPIERRVLLRRFFALSEDDRQTLRRRLREVDELQPKQRRKFIGELRDLMRELPEETKRIGRIGRNLDRWRRMSESERDQYREQLRRFRAMSVEDRRVLLDRWEMPEPGGEPGSE